jgi:hypothetical protein
VRGVLKKCVERRMLRRGGREEEEEDVVKVREFGGARKGS